MLDCADGKGSLAVFIASSDNTRDVFELVSASFGRFWGRCSFTTYVGQNSMSVRAFDSRFQPVLAQESSWHQEIYDQLSQIKEEFVLLLLDDFLMLEEVDEKRINVMASLVKRQQIDYLRLIEIERSWFARAVSRLFALLRGNEIQLIRQDMPYYSSLQAAIWRREYLLEVLQASSGGTIWEFEHHVLPGHSHYAVSRGRVICYRHVVEKGRWLPDAARLFDKRGIMFVAGDRSSWPPGYIVRMYIDRLVFGLIGYSWVRAKGILSRFSRNIADVRGAG